MHATTAPHPAPPQATVLPGTMMPGAADEVNHRMANHLQLLAALIAVEARGVSDPEGLAALERTQQRIAAIGGVHRHLYAGGTGEVDMGDYLETLGEQLSLSCARHRRVLVDAETVPVTSATASLIGILATELVTNACKHAYAAGEAGGILIGLRRLPGGTCRFTVEDRGRGTRGHTGRTGLGTRLIDASVAKLGAVARWEDACPGTRFRMDVRF
ncbi:sensor histidine kinase [Sphingomonas sp. S2-65]|uniref:sensor histidine kinase n=1 Tax=Sphingomonas sp. S2-65 TaxID=2903960 RepID=UPI001F468F8B|nr:sensor histidine kinase [Sphingomonas sp. S2-65]UYY58437.1 sensor histidine kinase [Sphingomonas sp. S2-65]